MKRGVLSALDCVIKGRAFAPPTLVAKVGVSTSKNSLLFRNCRRKLII